MKICGPKLSLCGLVVSVWGIIQLLVMGILYKVNSVALLEDIPIAEEYEDIKKFYAEAGRGYSLNAYNCWIAALMYILTLLFSGYQFYVNNRASV